MRHFKLRINCNEMKNFARYHCLISKRVGNSKLTPLINMDRQLGIGAFLLVRQSLQFHTRSLALSHLTILQAA